ncbi:MAG: AAA family ATPase [Frankiaceae bacterium]|nr:AAA family ATPase [Frankiaceae bacterium]MBV9872935.1 AAA family ATPase [Frankiaceae bacterium]
MRGASHDRVLLIGMMGAGKTTIGRELSNLLGWRYLDNDELVARVAGKDTRRVLAEDGIETLRRLESAALTIALTDGGPLIAGCAAGVVTDPLDLRRLHDGGYVVWLRADLTLLARRITGTDRPWLTGSPESVVPALYAGREALYTTACSLVIDVDRTTPEQAALDIVRGLTGVRAE